MSWIYPFTDKNITSHYGTLSDFRRERGMQPHSGLDYGKVKDFLLPAGTLIPTIASGVVTMIQYSQILGWVMEWKVKDNKGAYWYLAYSHLYCKKHKASCNGSCDTPFSNLKVGDKIEVGELRTRLGNSGSASSGPHVHITASKKHKGVFGVTSDKVDPYKLIQANLQKTAEKPVIAKPENKVTAKPEIKTVFACPHCFKELR